MKFISKYILFFFLLSTLSIIARSFSDNNKIVLITTNHIYAQIVIESHASRMEHFAARELQHYILKITDKILPIRLVQKKNHNISIFIGKNTELKSKGLQKEINNLKPNGFIIKQIGKSIFIVGHDDLGTLYGVYYFLEMFGVRWFMPGSIGEVVPKKNTLSIDNVNVRQEPDFAFRWIGMNQWSRRNMMNVNIPMGKDTVGIRVWLTSDEPFRSFHAFYDLLNPNIFFKDHPEYFSYYDGSRHKYNPGLGPKYGLNWRNQICTSNPEVILQVASDIQKILKKNPEINVITLSPNDGAGFCECPNCKALDEKGDAPDQLMSRRLLIFYDRVADIIKKTNPRVLIKFGAYFIYARPPRDTTLKALKNMAVNIQHYEDYSLSHPINDPVSKRNRKFKTILKGWKNVAKNIYEYEDYYKVNWFELPFPIVHTIRKDIPYLKRLGIDGFYTQYSKNNSFTLLLNYYVAAKLLWNVNTNVDSLLNDFYTKFYGKAWQPMKKYYATMEKAMNNPKLDIPGDADKYAFKVFTNDVLKKCKEYLIIAKSLAQNDIVKKRIKMAWTSYDYTRRCVTFLRFAAHSKSLKELKKTSLLGNNLMNYLKINIKKFKYIMDMRPLTGIDFKWYLGSIILRVNKDLKQAENITE